jgi:hypothetical protein
MGHCGEPSFVVVAETRDLTQGWHGPRVELLIYVHLLPHCPLKEFGELL